MLIRVRLCSGADIKCVVVPAGGGPLATTRVYAGGICCPMEVPLIERLLRPLPGVVQVPVCSATVLLSFSQSARHAVCQCGWA